MELGQGEVGYQDLLIFSSTILCVVFGNLNYLKIFIFNFSFQTSTKKLNVTGPPPLILKKQIYFLQIKFDGYIHSEVRIAVVIKLNLLFAKNNLHEPGYSNATKCYTSVNHFKKCYFDYQFYCYF